MGELSIGHWLIVLLIVAMVSGTKKLRNIGSDLGGAVKGFKDGMREGEMPAAETPSGAAPHALANANITDVDAREKVSRTSEYR